MRTLVVTLLLTLFIITPSQGQNRPTAIGGSFLDLKVHALVGGSYMTNNYKSCYPQISDINTSIGAAGGIGAMARFNLRSYLGLATEVNLTRDYFKLDMAVVGSDGRSVSNVYERNVCYRLDFPVYMTFLVNLGSHVRWNIDAGLYYSYGLGGHQKSRIYDVRSNDLGQLMMTVTPLKADFYNDARAFINSYKRDDIGLHIATGLTINSHLHIGGRLHVGFTNASYTSGLVRPSCHNVDFMVSLGWFL